MWASFCHSCEYSLLSILGFAMTSKKKDKPNYKFKANESKYILHYKVLKTEVHCDLPTRFRQLNKPLVKAFNRE